MDGTKEFLESSTVHGLTYISTSKNCLVKLFWITVVIGGFTTASILINFSFSDWKDSPISTSFETFPISKMLYPNITVCPPEFANTALNFDLQLLENATLDTDTRHSLVKLIKNTLQDSECNDTINEEDE